MLVYRVDSRTLLINNNVGQGPYNPIGDLDECDMGLKWTAHFEANNDRIHVAPSKDGIEVSIWDNSTKHLVFGFHTLARAKRWWKPLIRHCVTDYGWPETYKVSVYDVPDEHVIMKGDNPRQIAFDSRYARFILTENLDTLYY